MIKTHCFHKKYFLTLTAVILLSVATASGVLLLVSSDLKYKAHIIPIISTAILIILISAVILYFMYKQISKTLRQMTKLVDNIGNGEFENKIPLSGIKEFYQLELALNNLAETVYRKSKSDNKFISNVCHELRTPLTSISGFVDGIIDGTIPPEKESQYLKLISQEVKRLTRLTTLILNLEQLESGSIKPVLMMTNVINIIVDILNSFEKRINEKDIKILGLDTDITVFADKDMLYQVMYNLIENAVKFTPQNGYIEFKFSDDRNYSYISIKNSGEGLTEIEKEKVFNRFYKTNSSLANNHIGAGLGLNIVQTIVSIHNGTIDVDSVKGEYTQFTFSIPSADIPL